MIRTITFGYREEGLELHKWAYTNTKLLAVVLPDNRLEEPTTPLIKTWVYSKYLPLLIQTKPTTKGFIDQVRNFSPHLILCYCYTYKLPKDILEIPPLGCINIHPGELPKYPGRRPIEMAVENKEKELWATLHYMNEEFDSGKTIEEDSIPNTGNIEEMRKALTEVGLNLIAKNWENII